MWMITFLDPLSTEFTKVMSKNFKMSMMSELTFLLGLQVKQLTDGIFIFQAKYVTSPFSRPEETDFVYAS